MSEQAYIAIGSNIDPERNMPRSVARLRAIGTILGISSVYQSPAVAAADQPDFLNAAVLVETDLVPETIRRRLREIEAALGRVRSDDVHAARPIDLDLCLYGSAVMRTGELILPHPDLETHAYVSVPLAELSPDFVHPGLELPLSELAARAGGMRALTVRRDIALSEFAGRAGGRPTCGDRTP